jgi:hypothetical protein
MRTKVLSQFGPLPHTLQKAPRMAEISLPRSGRVAAQAHFFAEPLDAAVDEAGRRGCFRSLEGGRVLAVGWGFYLHAKYSAHRLTTGVRVRYPPHAPPGVPTSARECAYLSDEGGGIGHVDVDLAVHEYRTYDFLLGRAGPRSRWGGAEGSFHV